MAVHWRGHPGTHGDPICLTQDIEQRVSSIEATYNNLWRRKAEKSDVENLQRAVSQQRADMEQLRGLVANEVSKHSSCCPRAFSPLPGLVPCRAAFLANTLLRGLTTAANGNPVQGMSPSSGLFNNATPSTAGHHRPPGEGRSTRLHGVPESRC